MNDNIVKLVFKSVSEGGGLDDFISKSKKSLTNAGKLAQGIGILSQSFGSLGGMIGKALGMFMQGGIWGAAAVAVNHIVDAYKAWRDEAKVAAMESDKAVRETKQRSEAAAEAIKTAYEKATAAIDDEIKKKKEEIEINRDLAKSELELAAAKARASGDEKKAKKAEKEAAEVDKKAEGQLKAATKEAAEKKLAEAKKQAVGNRYIKEDGTFDKKLWENDRRSRNGRIMNLRKQIEEGIDKNREAVTQASDPGGARKKIIDTDLLEKELEAEQKARREFIAQGPKLVQIAKNIATAKREVEEVTKKETIAQNKANKSIEEGKAKKKDEAARAEAEAKRRAAAEKAGIYKGVLTASKSRFEDAFDLWRDPEAAQRAQDESKARGEDLKRFNKTVDRYGGKWRIDEAARLMREGDEAGLQERLADWRKSRKFNGQTEQMVLAAAAKQNERAAERSLEKIEKTSGEIKQSLEAIRQAFEG